MQNKAYSFFHLVYNQISHVKNRYYKFNNMDIYYSNLAYQIPLAPRFPTSLFCSYVVTVLLSYMLYS